MTEIRPPSIALPLHGDAPEAVPAELLRTLAIVSSATASATLYRMGIARAAIRGPRLLHAEPHHVVGRAITLQFMPQREDVASGLGQEHAEKRSALWSVFEQITPGDVLVIQAFGDLATGCMGEMLTTYLKARGGRGAIVDGAIRDWPKIRDIGLPIWARGTTPNFASQSGLFPWAFNCPVACGGVLVLPGDVVVADADGAVVVPRNAAEQLAENALHHEEWEEFSRMRLQQGGALGTYYPLSEEGEREYQQWRQGKTAAGAGSPERV
jgi:regulator of RNase E activity RraA